MGIGFEQIHPKDLQNIEDLECVICRELAQKPYECSKCKKPFCYNCVVEWKKLVDKCPFKCSIDIFKYEPISKEKMLKYSNTRIKCTRGCGCYVEFKNFIEHISLCGCAKCKNNYLCKGNIKYKFDNIETCSYLCYTFNQLEERSFSASETWNLFKLSNINFYRKYFPMEFDSYKSSKLFIFKTKNCLKSLSKTKNFYSAISKTALMGGIHHIKFKIVNSRSHFKVGISKSFNFDVEAQSFSDTEDGFGFYSIGQTRQGSCFSGMPLFSKLSLKEIIEIHMIVSLGDGRMYISFDNLEELAFEDERLKEGPIYICASFSDAVDDISVTLVS